MYSKEYILSIKKEKPKTSGVYFLIYKDEIVYIGQSKNIYKRIFDHKIKFDSIAIIKCKGVFALKELEREYLIKFKPKYNKNVGQGWEKRQEQHLNRKGSVRNPYKRDIRVPAID